MLFCDSIDSECQDSDEPLDPKLPPWNILFNYSWMSLGLRVPLMPSPACVDPNFIRLVQAIASSAMFCPVSKLKSATKYLMILVYCNNYSINPYKDQTGSACAGALPSRHEEGARRSRSRQSVGWPAQSVSGFTLRFACRTTRRQIPFLFSCYYLFFNTLLYFSTSPVYEDDGGPRIRQPSRRLWLGKA